jgi:3-oxoacyl-(acyl-carrier-protein) synthase
MANDVCRMTNPDRLRCIHPETMTTAEPTNVVITGIGMVTPLGNDPAEVLRRIQAGDSAAAAPTGFDASVFACPVCAQVKGFESQRYVSETKMVRLMSRDAQLAVAAARLALADAHVKPGVTYAPEEVALFGATGLAGLPLREVIPLIQVSTGPQGEFDLTRFGQAGLKAVSPVLSFKILSNMPFCFVSINENVQGPNAIYTPWEGAGAQAIEVGVRTLQAGHARCALVGGCDVKTHELAFATLQQQGVFERWRTPPAQTSGGPASLRASSLKQESASQRADAHSLESASGIVPAEGAAFLVLETETEALARRAHIYGRLSALGLRSEWQGEDIVQTRADVLRQLNIRCAEVLVSSEDGEGGRDGRETSILKLAGISVGNKICPKKHLGDLFAAAALVQVAIGAVLTEAGAATVVANCFGHGGTQAAIVLEKEPPRLQGRRRSRL